MHDSGICARYVNSQCALIFECRNIFHSALNENLNGTFKRRGLSCVSATITDIFQAQKHEWNYWKFALFLIILLVSQIYNDWQLVYCCSHVWFLLASDCNPKLSKMVRYVVAAAAIWNGENGWYAITEGNTKLRQISDSIWTCFTVNSNVQLNGKNPHVAIGWRFSTCSDNCVSWNWKSYWKSIAKVKNREIKWNFSKFFYRERYIRIIAAIYSIIRYVSSSFTLHGKKWNSDIECAV